MEELSLPSVWLDQRIEYGPHRWYQEEFLEGVNKT